MRNKSRENFIYLESVNLLSFNSSFIKMGTKTKFLVFLSVKQFLQEKKKIRRMRFYLLLSNYLIQKIELQRTEISLHFIQFIFKLNYWENQTWHMAVEKARTMVSQNVVKKEVTTATKNIGKLFQNDGENIRKSC